MEFVIGLLIVLLALFAAATFSGKKSTPKSTGWNRGRLKF